MPGLAVPFQLDRNSVDALMIVHHSLWEPFNSSNNCLYLLALTWNWILTNGCALIWLYPPPHIIFQVHWVETVGEWQESKERVIGCTNDNESVSKQRQHWRDLREAAITRSSQATSFISRLLSHVNRVTTEPFLVSAVMKGLRSLRAERRSPVSFTKDK